MFLYPVYPLPVYRYPMKYATFRYDALKWKTGLKVITHYLKRQKQFDVSSEGLSWEISRLYDNDIPAKHLRSKHLFLSFPIVSEPISSCAFHCTIYTTGNVSLRLLFQGSWNFFLKN